MTVKSDLRPHHSFLGPIGRLADAGIDWQGVGFRCGLEIHQQLYTEKKLFCRCPAGRYSDHYDMEVLRHMRPTLSELGEYDGTALMEFKTKKEIIYRLNRESVCTYEMDDTPPFEINQQAIDIAIEIALLCGCKLVGELHVIRKQYLDGSIPAGFQRTAIIGVDGAVPFRGRMLPILQVSVEEDACREVSDRGHTIVFRTDRLSMPLVEIVTGPELRCPSEAGQAAQVLGDLMRATGKVRRGLGATREDVNVSVTGGTRVEIKGVPQIKRIPHLVRNEALRQRALLELRERLKAPEGRGSDAPMIRPVDDIVLQGRNTMLARAVREGLAVMAVRIPFARGLVDAPTQPGRTFLDELKGRIRVIACLDQPPYCFASPDESNLTHRRWKLIRHRLRTKSADAVVVCWGPQRDVETALQEVILRFADALAGVPNETRQAGPGGLTDFERILPGPDRMYPDTDSPPTAIAEERIEAIRQRLPDPPWTRVKILRDGGVPEADLDALTIGPRYTLARKLIEAGHDGRLVGYLLGNLVRWFTRRGFPVAALPDDALEEVARRLHAGELFREGLPRLLRTLIRHTQEQDTGQARQPDVAAVCERLQLVPLAEDPGAVIRQALSEAPRARSAAPDARLRHAMAAAMARCRGRVPGRRVFETVSAILKGEQHVG
ncbi:MAG: Glu-tRNA(Gln) amidotransferase subunit GatE [bacterium]